VVKTHHYYGHSNNDHKKNNNKESRNKKVKPVIPNFHDWKKGKTPEGKGICQRNQN